MSLEFAIEHSCVLRARYAEKHLRAWGRLSSIHARLTTGSEAAPSADALRFVESVRGEIEEIQGVTADACPQCPACLPTNAAGEGEAVGCLGRITYPVEAEFEKFLADRVQLALDITDEEDYPRLLRILIDADSPFDGEGAKELRRVTTSEGLRFFQLRLPINLARAGVNVTTDNLFDMLAGFKSDASERTTYARELPAPAAADYYDFLDLMLRNDLTEQEIARLHARSRNYAQYLRLLAALERAEALDARVLLD